MDWVWTIVPLLILTKISQLIKRLSVVKYRQGRLGIRRSDCHTGTQTKTRPTPPDRSRRTEVQIGDTIFSDRFWVGWLGFSIQSTAGFDITVCPAKHRNLHCAHPRQYLSSAVLTESQTTEPNYSSTNALHLNFIQFPEWSSHNYYNSLVLLPDSSKFGFHQQFYNSNVQVTMKIKIFKASTLLFKQ